MRSFSCDEGCWQLDGIGSQHLFKERLHDGLAVVALTRPNLKDFGVIDLLGVKDGVRDGVTVRVAGIDGVTVTVNVAVAVLVGVAPTV